LIAVRLADSHNVSIVNTDDEIKQQKGDHVFDYGLVAF